ncbi:hypothetical protein NDU88_003994 [Pleurodeles waltl]|uniref:Uncharacterized protein n=1 Tax=Pleurodeles waltl TaxID=8319 RepID=A0AAV7UFW8_PLEWA|nr:hypothetical protein NDU88_003994 [Pleurodeles waltl]
MGTGGAELAATEHARGTFTKYSALTGGDPTGGAHYNTSGPLCTDHGIGCVRYFGTAEYEAKTRQFVAH